MSQSMLKRPSTSANLSQPTFRVGALGLVCAAGLFASGLGGCAGSADLAKQVDALRTEVSSVRATNAALQERLDALEIQGGKLKTADVPPTEPGTGPAPAAPPADAAPELRVVRLTPSEDATGGGEIEPASRVKIRSTPSGLVQEEAGTADAQDTASAADFKKAKDFYDKKAWGDALKSFSAFTQRYPEHAKIPEATYYKGLCQSARGDTKLAAETFETVSSSFPRSDIAPDALYEAMKARDKLGDKEGADRARNKLKKDFPKSAAAKKLEKK